MRKTKQFNNHNSMDIDQSLYVYEKMKELNWCIGSEPYNPETITKVIKIMKGHERRKQLKPQQNCNLNNSTASSLELLISAINPH